MQMLKTVIWMRKVIVMLKILVYSERSTSKAFGYDIVLRNAGNRFLTDFRGAAIFEDWGDLVEDWGDLSGQPRSSQPEEEFRDLGDSGEPRGGREEDFKGFREDFEGI